jgi:hypothetical protein
MNEIKNPKFFTAGKAIFTVSNASGQHYTYRIGHKDDTQPFFVGLLTGPQNDTDYTYMGIFNPENNDVRLTKKSTYTEDTTAVKVIRWALKKVLTGSELPPGYSIQHAGKCCCCGRTLTTPESVDKGIGPECEKKHGW